MAVLARVLSIVVLAFVLPMRVAAQEPGALDPTFGLGGLVLSDFGGVENAKALAIQPDGKIIVAGVGNTIANNDFLLARYLSNGTPDPTFGNGGVVVTDFGGFEYLSAVRVQPDGKIVGAGRSDNHSALVRYLPDGRLDAAFGAAGIVRSNLGGFDEFSGLILQPDGKLVGIGTALRGTFDFALARYNPDGTPDLSFGNTGRTVSDWGAPELAFAAAIQPDGRLVVVGEFERRFTDAQGITRSNDDFAVARYNADGTLDTNFGLGGLVTTEFTVGANELAEAVTIQPDGKIVAAGTRILAPANGGLSDFALARYNTNGTPDPTFGNLGLVVIAPSPGGVAGVHGISLQADNKLLAFGISATAITAAADFTLVRYLPGGGLDASFGTGGIVKTALGVGTQDEGDALALQADGKAIGVGIRNDNSGGYDVALARYITASAPTESPVPIASPNTLWPPDHKMRNVTITVARADGAPFGPGCAITSVESSEGAPVPGQADSRVTGPLTLELRAERSGAKQDRVYTITVTCAASPQSAAVTVRVPHDQSKPK